jgi:S-adenosylmethionine hydrolase
MRGVEAQAFLIPGTVSDSVERAGCLSIPCLNGTFENPEGERLDESDHYVDDRLRHERPPGGRAERRHPENLHVVVVDPGVGTDRRPLIVSGQNQYFLAPDNGVLSGVFDKEQNFLVRHLTAEHYFLQPVSRTFHGRDVFAPVAGWLSKNWQPGSMGEEITDFKRFALPRPKEADGLLKGVVMKVDSFGNLITNFREEDLPAGAIEKGEINLQIGSHAVIKLVPTFALGSAGEAIAYVGSSGNLEIGVNKGSASKTLGLGRGTPVLLNKG